MTTPTPRTTLDTTGSSLRILELVKELDGATLSEVAAASDLAKSTVHTHLQTLYANEFLVRDGEEYVLGYKFLNYGEYVRYRDPAHPLIEETIHDLADATEEEVAFGVEDHGRQITVHEVYDDSHVRERHSGSFHCMHNTATGKAILAEYPAYRVEEILDRRGLPAMSDRTITSRDALFDDLEAIESQGYAINDEEFLDGLRAIGAAVTDPSGAVVGGISVSGPAYRITVDRLVEDVRPELLSAIEDLEAALAERTDGQRPPTED